MKGIIGKKLGMTQIFDEKGRVVPVTVVEAGPCKAVQVKTEEVDGYSAVVLAFGEVKEARVNKAQLGAFKKAEVKPAKVLREIKLENVKVGDEIKAGIFEKGEAVDAIGTTRGRGFTGNIQRWNTRRLKMTHGTGPVHREVGSTGSNSTPSRVLPGKKMPGQYGNEKNTILNLEIAGVDEAKNVLLIKGSIPGKKGSLVVIRSAVKAKA